MAYEVVLPRLGWNMESGRVGEWLKQEGDHVEAGEILFVVEGDKAAQEIEALDSGILRFPPDAPRAGQEVPVGTLLAYLLEPHESLPFPAPSANSAPTLPEVSGPLEQAGALTTLGADTPRPPLPTISPRARRVAAELGVEWALLRGSGRTGRIVERDVRAAAQAADAGQTAALPAHATTVKASAVARRLAADLEIDVEALGARMPGRRIGRADVEREAARQDEGARNSAEPASARNTQGAANLGMPPMQGELLPISPIRRTIAERMAASSQTTAPVTLTTEVDASELVRMRKQIKDAGQVAPTYNDLLAKLCAGALMEHPQVNAHFEGDGIRRATTAHIGVAVDTERG
ncbi:MAG: 2-oxo acid dehydrogenase subunit E2, partial [Caldilineaceae bacterium]